MKGAAITNRSHGGFAFACLAALALLVSAYANHFDNAFHFDDSHVIVGNSYIHSLSNFVSFFSDPHTFSVRPESALYRPLLTLSHALDYRLGDGLNPRAFHRTQFALHVLLGVLLVALFRRLADLGERAPANRYLALFAATLFCVHTANTETINYISSRSSLVATLAVVASLLTYLVFPGARRFGLHIVPMLIGGLAKPLTVIYAPILLVFVLLFEGSLDARQLFGRAGRKEIGSALIRTAPTFVAAGALFVFLARMTPSTVIYATTDRWSYLMTQPFVWLHYVRLFLLPAGLTADPDWKLVSDWHDTRLFVGLLFVGLLAAAIAVTSTRRRWRPVAFGLAWFALALLPTSSVIPLSEVYNEHRIFFPYVGLSLAVCWSLWLVLGRSIAPRGRGPRALLLLAGVAVLAAHAVGTHQRNRVWRDELALWEDVTRKSPANGRGLMNYGVALMQRGSLELAREQFERATLYTPNYEILQVNLAVVKSALGDDAGAEAHFKRAIELNPRYGSGRFYYARWLVDQDRGPEAVDHLVASLDTAPGDLHARTMLSRLRAATGAETELLELAGDTLRITPNDRWARAYVERRPPVAAERDTPEAYATLARRQLRLGDWFGAAESLRHILRLGADDAATRYGLGRALEGLGFLELAALEYRTALEHDPASVAARSGLARLDRPPGRDGAASVDELIDLSLELFRAGRYAEVIDVCRDALVLDPASAVAYNNICSAQIELGERAGAIAACRAALDLDPTFERARNNLESASRLD